jgi:TPP-dependent 2-oxoacid decarboxylase
MTTHAALDTPFIPAPRITTVAGYLLTRLAEAGLISTFGVAGDYNLPILDAITDRPDLAWIGMATEQGAGCAADSYAVAAFTGRVRRMLAAADSASLLVGHLAARHRVTSQVRDLAVAGDFPVAVLATAKGEFPEPDPRFAGLYAGPASGKRARMAVEDADLLITAGVTLADTVLGGAHQLSAPAALGASLAAPDRRVVLIIGDGALQQTAAELGTLLGQGLAPVIIVLNNGGYTSERAVSHPDASYHQIPAWDWTALPVAVAPARGTVSLRIRTRDELAWAINAACYHASAGRPVLIEAVLAADDAPPCSRT